MTPQTDTTFAGHTCLRCRKQTTINMFLSPFTYHDLLIRRILHEFKYNRIQSLSPLIAHLLVSYLRHYNISIKKEILIIPIPLHPRKERVRGFNQSRLIAQDISHHLSLPIDTHTLIRTTFTTPQTKLHAQDRRLNVEHIFALRDPNPIRGRTIILIDDVKTTGATLYQAAYILKQAKAKEIWAMTFAH